MYQIILFVCTEINLRLFILRKHAISNPSQMRVKLHQHEGNSLSDSFERESESPLPHGTFGQNNLTSPISEFIALSYFNTNKKNEN